MFGLSILYELMALMVWLRMCVAASLSVPTSIAACSAATMSPVAGGSQGVGANESPLVRALFASSLRVILVRL
jgi:hypothetical protein